MPPFDPVPGIILLAVFALIAVRQVGTLRLAIWQIMLGGALAALLSGSIGPSRALSSIDIDVMVFLFGMFVVGEAMVESRYLHHIADRLFRSARSASALVLYILFIMAFFSAVLMNDTVAIIGTPLMLSFAKKHGIKHKLLLLTLCFAITIGSVVSPIGNPQNLLIALHGGIANPFVTFFKYLAVPTIINLFLTFFVLRIFFREEFHAVRLLHPAEEVSDRALAWLCRLSIAVILIMVAIKVGSVFLEFDFGLKLTYIALAAAAPVMISSPRRLDILRKIDWHTLFFFASMFVLMASVWDSGLIQRLAAGWSGAGSHVSILALSVLLSQLLSNVPFVALYLPVLDVAGGALTDLMALAAGSTIAGNLLVLGAASNIIVIQNSEKNGVEGLSFLDFARVGVPLTIANTAVYWAYFELILHIPA
ncbi:MAG: anion transporter [Deltaproteobacteria bacterium]|nr:anion transporter [Deltaproteobacteria bacterium]MBZ0219181.1 anion transporter [Deltaproteobacteria bacterium]